MSLDGKLIPHDVGKNNKENSSTMNIDEGRIESMLLIVLIVLSSCKKSMVLPDIGKRGGTNI